MWTALFSFFFLIQSLYRILGLPCVNKSKFISCRLDFHTFSRLHTPSCNAVVSYISNGIFLVPYCLKSGKFSYLWMLKELAVFTTWESFLSGWQSLRFSYSSPSKQAIWPFMMHFNIFHTKKSLPDIDYVVSHLIELCYLLRARILSPLLG
jgi:hypothetical protein